MERASFPSKVLLSFLLLSQLLEARILGDAYNYKRLVASDGDDDAVLSSPHLNLPRDAVDRHSKHAPPSPKHGPSPHPILGSRPPQRRDGDGALEQQRWLPASPAEPAPPRDYSRQQAEAAGHPPGRPGEMMHAFLQAIRYVRQIYKLQLGPVHA
nr:uncharacterized protein LOC120972824 [Aegilops tauschii subsp. strangulata]